MIRTGRIGERKTSAGVFRSLCLYREALDRGRKRG